MGKNNLKDPDSAKFDDDKFGAFKENGIIKMSGIVRAKNSFNAIVPANGMLRWTHLRIMCSTHL